MENKNTSSPKILIVDDEAYNVGMLDFIFKKEGYETDSANDGQTALDKVSSGNYSLIILDLFMPGMDGYEVIARLKENENTRDIPVIFISAFRDEKSYIKGIELGALDFFTKPFNRHELVTKIRNFQRLSQLEYDLRSELQERMLVEEELVQSESRYRSIIEDQTEFLVRQLPDGTQTFVNGAYCEFAKRSAEELVGGNYFEGMPLDLKAKILATFQKLTPGNAVQTEVYPAISPSGQTYWHSWTHRALFDSSGELAEIQSVGRDITEAKASEESIRLVSEVTAGLIGKDFFETLVNRIVEILNVDYAFVADWNSSNQGVAFTLAASKRGEIMDNLSYPLSVSPGSEIFSTGPCFYPKDIQKHYPKDDMLKLLGAEGYAGIVLHGKDRVPIGILVIIHSQELTNPELIKSQLRTYSVRAAAELERMNSDQKLLRSEEMFRLSFSHASIGKVLADPQGRLIQVNEAFCDITGYSKEELHLRNWMEILMPEYHHKISSFVRRLEDKELPSYTLDQEVKRKDGQIRWVSMNLVVIWGADMKPLHFYADVIDITQRKENEKRLELALGVSGAGVYEYSYPGYKNSFFGKRWKSILGLEGVELPSEELINDWYNERVHPEDLPGVRKLYQRFISGKSRTFQTEYRVRKKADQWIFIQDIAHAIDRDKQGKAQRIIGITRDITYNKRAEEELRESKERFEKIFMTSPELITISNDQTGEFVEVNDVFVKTLGYPRKQIIGASITGLDLWADISQKEEIHEALDRKGYVNSYEVSFRTKSGKLIPILVSCTMIQLSGTNHVLTVGANIEKLKQVQKSLQESETKYRLLADYNYDWEYWIGPDGKFIYISPSCERITGYTADDFTADPELLYRIVHPDFLEEVKASASEKLSTYKQRDFKIVDRSGEEKWISHHYLPVYGEQGEYLGKRGNYRDITENKVSELELKKLTVAIRQSNSAIMVTDTEGRIEFVNPYFEKLTGYSAEEAVGLTPSILKSEKTSLEVHRDLWDTIRSGKVWRGEIINRKKNGEEYDEFAVITPVRGLEGEIINYIALKEDVTERNKATRALLESESNFRNIFEASSDGILISTLDLKVLDANQALVNDTGYTREEFIGTGVFDMVDPDYADQVKISMKELIEKGVSSTAKFVVMSRNGEKMAVEITGSLIDYSGEKAVLTIVRDIRVQEEMQRRIFNAIIETEEKERSRFATDLHDGLGPLLSTTKLYIKALATIQDEEQKAIAITNSQVAIDEAIASIREISYNISPHILRNFGLVSALKTYVNKINETGQIQISLQSTLEYRPQENVELSLFRVVIELINNTLKYAEAENGFLEIHGGEDKIQISFADDGKGFDVEKVLKNPTGRGMQNIVNRVESLYGKIQFSSSKGKGMKVKIEI